MEENKKAHPTQQILGHKYLLGLKLGSRSLGDAFVDKSVGPRLDHTFIRLGSTPPTPLSLPGLLACTCVGTLPRWEPM